MVDREADEPEELEALLYDCLERIEREGPYALEEVCAEHPSRAEELRESLRALRVSGLLPKRDESETDFPEHLGDFRLLSRLGGGGMGVVYLAEQMSLERRVALKLLRPDQVYFRGARRRFEREVNAVSRLSHPNIVPVYTVGEERGIPFFTMEHVEGATLSELVARLGSRAPETLEGADAERALAFLVPGSDVDVGALAEVSWVDASVRIAREVALALEHAHGRGVLHRDVKLSNVMLTSSGRVMLFDFGLAGLEGARRVTKTGAVIGSLPYMSPEQVAGEGERVGARTDVYSLGVTLYELLTLRLPHWHQSEESTRRAILAGNPRSIRERNPAVHVDVETVCLKAMDPDPARRYASAAELALDLANVLERRPITARRTGALLRVRRWSQRNPAALIAILLGALVFFGMPLGYGVQKAQAMGRIEDAGTKLARALATADEEREHAKRNLDRAITAVDRMLTQVADEDLGFLPGMGGLRRDLLREAQSLFRGMIRDEPGYEYLEENLMRAHRRVGRLLLNTGRVDEAEEAYGEQLALLDGLLADSPGDVGLRIDLGDARGALRRVYRRQGRFDEEETAALRQIEVYGALAEEFPGEARYGQLVSEALSDYGWTLENRGRPDAAELEFRRSIELMEGILAELPEELDADEEKDVRGWKANLAHTKKGLATILQERAELAEAEEQLLGALELVDGLDETDPTNQSAVDIAARISLSLGILYRMQGRHGEAERFFLRDLEISERLWRQYPHMQVLGGHLLVSRLNRAVLLVQEKDYDGAVEILNLADALGEQLLEQHSGQPDVLFDSAHVKTALGDVHRLRDEPEIALGFLEESLAIKRDLAERFPEVRRYRDLQFPDIANLAEVYLALASYDEAAAYAREVVEIGAQPERERKEVTSLIARIAREIGKDEALDAEARAMAAEPFALEALELLRAAVDDGIRFDLADDDWDAIRDHPDFDAIVEEARKR